MVIHSLEKQKKYFEPSLSHAYFNLINEILTGQMNDDKVLLKKWKLLNLRVFPEVVMTAGFIYTQTEYFDLTKQLQMKTILSNVRQVTKYWDGAVVTPWSVSYTHLDVYKRQMIIRAILLRRKATLYNPMDLQYRTMRKKFIRYLHK